jgi:hypothetical protein
MKWYFKKVDDRNPINRRVISAVRIGGRINGSFVGFR